MRKFTLVILLAFPFLKGEAQQLHFTSQYLQHNFMYNPGAAGIANNNMIGISYRDQWSSFPGNPKTYMLYGDFSLNKMKAGAGAYIYRDETGPTSRTGIDLSFSKHIISLDGKKKLGLGLEVRGLQYAIDKSKINIDVQGDPVLAGSGNKFAFDAGAGVYYTNQKLSVGAAVSQLIQSKLEFGSPSNANQRGKLYRHYVFNANYKIQTGDNIYVLPNAMMRIIEHSPSEYEFGAMFNYKEKIWWGLQYRIDQFWSMQAGVKILQKIGLTYSYDYYQTPINVFTSGSGAHEIGIRFDLKSNSPQF